ncbi:MAG: hypothetical protein SFX74_11620, partial [Fimbriimonadaceae bacterium]|nr:hypothetical protein [Fimbriimonadaceae bacterium]
MMNVLGHCEGMIYTEGLQEYACERFAGMQADPTSPAFQSTCSAMIRDVLADFDASVIHLGGDETWQLGHGTAS